MGGHGGLNILPQKSWNVWGQRNRQKVDEDEAKQAAKDAELRKRQEQAERADRLQKLRGEQPAEVRLRTMRSVQCCALHAMVCVGVVAQTLTHQHLSALPCEPLRTPCTAALVGCHAIAPKRPWQTLCITHTLSSIVTLAHLLQADAQHHGAASGTAEPAQHLNFWADFERANANHEADVCGQQGLRLCSCTCFACTTVQSRDSCAHYIAQWM